MKQAFTQTVITLTTRLAASILLSLAINTCAHALGGSLNNFSFTAGHLGAVGVERDDNGNPILAEFDSDGAIVGELPTYTGRDDLRVMPAADYNAMVALANQLQGDNPGASLMSRGQYESRAFKTVSGGPVNSPDIIGNDTRSVFITDERQLLVTTPPYESVILQEFPVDLSQGGITLANDIVTLLVDNNGSIAYQSKFDISYKVELFKENPDGVGRGDPITPVANALVYSGVIKGGNYGGGVGITDETGKYLVNVLVPSCPGFAYSYRMPITAEVFVANFNPKAQGKYPGYIPVTRFDEKFCSGYSANPPGLTLGGLMAQVEAIGIEAALDTNTYAFDIWMSTMQLNAIGIMPGIELTEETTEYASDDNAIGYTGSYNFDFDGDGTLDEVVTNPDDASKVDIYLGGNPAKDELGVRNTPDITRLRDHVLQAQRISQGLLKSISKSDLQDTDIYIYRASTNQLLGQLEGLVERDENGPINTGAEGESALLYKGIHEDEPIATFGFSSLLIGAASFDYFSDLETVTEGRRRIPWVPTESAATEFTDDNRPDFLRPGEEVKIIAINRATGYIGSQSVRLKEIFNIPTDTIKLYPPNLKIIATRTYKDEKGLSKGTQHDNQLIGSEGAGLTSDTYVKIQTIWLDQDGGVLPENLPGYTGRLAISTGSATEDFSGNFAIKPGYQTEFVQLNNKADLTTEHFYVQVVGENFDGNPSFASPGAGPGKLATRPAKYTPVLVPIFNEQATVEAQNALRDARAEGVANLPDEAEPVYHWVYRPEMQFSVYDLTVNDIRITDIDNSLNDSIINLDTSVVDGSGFIDIFLTLMEPDNSPLEFFGPGQDFVLQIGENEFSIATDINGEQYIQETNTGYFSDLSVDDFLSISIFLNNDSANVLWDFAFEVIDLFPPSSAGEVEVSADDNEVILFANLPGYLSRPEEKRPAYKLNWSSNGGSISPPSETNQDGSFSSSLLLPRNAGTEVVANAVLEDSPPIKSAAYKIVAGEPSVITLNQSGQTAIAGMGQISLQIEVKDNWGNFVSDGTSVSITTDSDVAISSDFITINGMVNATLKGVETPGIKNITVTAGEASQTVAVSVANINLAVSLPTNINPDEKVTVQLTASSDAGVVNNIYALLSTTKGQLNTPIVNFVNGNAEVELYAGEFPGAGVFSTWIGSSVKQTAYTVGSMGGAYNPDLSFPALMGDQTEDGSFTVTDLESSTDYTFDYNASTDLSITGTPGELVPVSIGSLYNPAIEPVLHYPLYAKGAQDEIFDRYNIIHGTSSDVINSTDSAKGFRGSVEFDGSGVVRVPNNVALNRTGQLGFSLNVKPQTSGGSIVNYAVSSQQLSYNNGRFEYQVTTADGTFNVSSTPATANEWHEIAAHYKDGELLLYVNGDITTVPATGDLIQQSSSSAILLGSSFQGNVSEFKVIDWSYPVLAIFPNGLTEDTLTITADGTAMVKVQSTGNMNQRQIVAYNNNGFDILNLFIPQAHADVAGTTQNILSSIQVGLTQAPFVIADSAIAAAQLGSDISAGIFLGDTSSTAGTTADFIVGFIPYFGDGRDLILQEYYQYIDSDKYDELIVILAGIGLAADTASLAGVLATIPSGGTTLTLAVAGQIVKNTVRAFKTLAKLIPNGPFRNILIAKFRDVLVAAKTGNWDRLSTMLSISALFVAVLGDEDLRNMMIGAIQTSEDFDAWAQYIFDFEEAPDTVANNSYPVLDFFISPIHAAPISVFKKKLDDLKLFSIDAGMFNGVKDMKQVGRLLTKAIKELDQFADDAIVKSVKYKDTTLQVLVSVDDILPGKGMRNLLKASEDRVSSFPDFLDKFTELLNTPPKLLSNSALKEQFTKVITDLGAGWRKSRGAIHQIHVLRQAVKDGHVIEAIEQEFDVLVEVAAGVTKKISKRIYDSVHRAGSVLIHVEAKAWSPTYATENLRQSMRYGKIKTVGANGAGEFIDNTNKPGQLLSDLANMYTKRGDATFKIEWHFDKRSIGKEGEYLDAIADELENGIGGKNLRKILGFVGDEDGWDTALLAINKKLDEGFVRVLSE